MDNVNTTERYDLVKHPTHMEIIDRATGTRFEVQPRDITKRFIMIGNQTFEIKRQLFPSLNPDPTLEKNHVLCSVDTIFKRFISILHKSNYCYIDMDIKMETKLMDDLGLDSLDAIELHMSVEEEFMITIPEYALENIVTVKDAVNCISKIINK